MIENEYRVTKHKGRYAVFHHYGDTDQPKTCKTDNLGDRQTVAEAEDLAKLNAARDPDKALYVTFIDRTPSRIIYPAHIIVDDSIDVVAEFSNTKNKEEVKNPRETAEN